MNDITSSVADEEFLNMRDRFITGHDFNCRAFDLARHSAGCGFCAVMYAVILFKVFLNCSYVVE